MDWLSRHLSIFTVPDLVLVIGAGRGSDIPALPRGPSTRLLLLEPQPQWASSLRRQVADHPGAEVHEYALDRQSGPATLKVFNFPELSSLQPDDRLSSLLPGARQTAELPVERRTLADLVAALGVQPGADNWLIVDSPGLEAAVLDGLEDADIRQHFGHVVLRSSRHDAYETGDPPVSWRERFVELGFHPLGSKDLSDGDWPRLHFQNLRPDAAREALEQKLAVFEQENAELTQRKAELQAQLEQLRLDYEASRSEADEKLRLAEQAPEESERLETLLEEARADLSSALRVVTLRDADLRDLQERYGKLLDIKNQQQELLGKLGHRLGAASEVLQALRDSEAASDHPTAVEGLVQALSGDVEAPP